MVCNALGTEYKASYAHFSDNIRSHWAALWVRPNSSATTIQHLVYQNHPMVSGLFAFFWVLFSFLCRGAIIRSTDLRMRPLSRTYIHMYCMMIGYTTRSVLYAIFPNNYCRWPVAWRSRLARFCAESTVVGSIPAEKLSTKATNYAN